MGRGRITSSSWPPAAPAVLLLLLLVCFSHGAAAARLLRPLQPSAAVVVDPPQVLQPAKNGVTAAAAVDGSLVVQEAGEAAGNGDELSISEMMGRAEETACEWDSDDECLERRLLGDAHLDYIYTQHKGKP